MEPASVLAKAWEQIERIGGRSHWSPQRVLVTGAGPIGLLAALLGVQRGLDVHVLDRATEGPKPALVRALGATYHTGSVEQACQQADIVLECTGDGSLVFEVMRHIGPQGIACLTGVSSGGRKLSVDLGELNRELVLENNVIVGSVNANRRHYESAAQGTRPGGHGVADGPDHPTCPARTVATSPRATAARREDRDRFSIRIMTSTSCQQDSHVSIESVYA